MRFDIPVDYVAHLKLADALPGFFLGLSITSIVMVRWLFVALVLLVSNTVWR